MLRSARDPRLYLVLPEPVLQNTDRLLNVPLSLVLLFRDLVGKAVVVVRVKVSKSEVFKLALDPVDPQPVRQWRVDVERLTGNITLLLFRLPAEVIDNLGY